MPAKNSSPRPTIQLKYVAVFKGPVPTPRNPRFVRFMRAKGVRGIAGQSVPKFSLPVPSSFFCPVIILPLLLLLFFVALQRSTLFHSTESSSPFDSFGEGSIRSNVDVYIFWFVGSVGSRCPTAHNSVWLTWIRTRTRNRESGPEVVSLPLRSVTY